VAKIKLDLDRRIGRLDRKVFGGFIEHLGRCIYGGIFDEDSPVTITGRTSSHPTRRTAPCARCVP
jgi:alpha-L-arabinofuranosidase